RFGATAGLVRARGRGADGGVLLLRLPGGLGRGGRRGGLRLPGHLRRRVPLGERGRPGAAAGRGPGDRPPEGEAAVTGATVQVPATSAVEDAHGPIITVRDLSFRYPGV